ncbi:MAG: hypothetical protein JO067_13835 [Cupriavidus sp.]|nr:hypothetical protein [Cupriavidus sp.]
MRHTIQHLPGALLLAALLTLCTQVHARSVRSITIIETGLSARDKAEESCKKFRPKINQIRNYFNHAYPVPSSSMVGDGYSPCYALGRVEFDDGFEAAWMLQPNGISLLDWSEGTFTVLYYKKNKWHAPYTGLREDDFDEEDNPEK